MQGVAHGEFLKAKMETIEIAEVEETRRVGRLLCMPPPPPAPSATTGRFSLPIQLHVRHVPMSSLDHAPFEKRGERGSLLVERVVPEGRKKENERQAMTS